MEQTEQVMGQAGGPAKDAYVRVGKVKDAHGIRGELFIVLFAGEAAWLEDLTEIRLVAEHGGREPQTFSVKSVRLHKNGLIVKSADIRDRNMAESLKGLLLEIPEELFVSAPGEAIYLREVLGFTVRTKAKGEVGTIIGFSNNVAQDLLVVKTAWGEFEIPFVEAYVEAIDYDARRMDLDLPEGLLGELDDNEEQEPAELDDNEEQRPAELDDNEEQEPAELDDGEEQDSERED